ncbi:MAG: NAD/NADP octopine/nopaline dehydrogenase family protein [Rhodobacter sp.]|nr:NAD/NADP octopine/nopaline dehydrogenase family protein [Rhodobacter sp.]
MIRVTVIGGEGVAASICAMACLQGHTVRRLRFTGEGRRDAIHCQLPNGTTFRAKIEDVPGDAERALRGADVVFVCVRHDEVDAVLQRIAPYLSPSALIGGVPGFGSFGVLARRRLPNNTVFGLQRIPFVVREFAFDRDLRIGGIRRQTFVGAIPNDRSQVLAALTGKTLGVPTVAVSHYFNIELSPSNSFLNPVRIYSLFANPAADELPTSTTEFFADWDARSSLLLLEIDAELQNVCRKVPRDTSFVSPILFQYEASDPAVLTQRIRSLGALHGRPVPLCTTAAGVAPDTGTSYFREDFDFGLRGFREISRLVEVDCDLTNRILAWRDTLGHAKGAAQQAANGHPMDAFNNIEDLARDLD